MKQDNRIHFGKVSVLFFLLTLVFTHTYAIAEESVCARVKIEISQEVSLERQAFDAHMRINNGAGDISLEDVFVELMFADDNGAPVLASNDPNNSDALFFFRIESLENISDVNGTGIVPPSTSADIHWLIIPSPGASNGLELGTLYMIGADISYSMGGEQESVFVSPDYIYVKPMPELTLDYFLPARVYGDDPFTPEIEPEIPFSLGVRVNNSGFGTAHSLKIDSAQPEIVENNQNLLFAIEILGSKVGNQQMTPSLLINFGEVEAGNSKVARWEMTSSLSGEFVSFTANYSHSDELGGELTSLISGVSTHLLIQDILVDLPGRDDIADFLIQESDSSYTVFESEGIDSPVTDQSTLATLTPTGQAGVYTLAVPATAGFMYVKLQDIFSGQKIIKDIIRSDGKRIATENGWLSKTKNGGDPWQYFFNILDVNTTNSYVVTFDDTPDTPNPPVLQYINDQLRVEEQLVSFVVEASDADGTIPTLSAQPLPVGASFVDQGNNGNGVATGLFEWTPLANQAGSYTLYFSASDGKLADRKSATLTIYSQNDRDNDGYSNEEEIAAGSDPDNPDSIPAGTNNVITLVNGYNLISFPEDLAGYPDLESVLTALGGESSIDKAQLFITVTRTFAESWYDTGILIGDNPPLSPGDNPNLVLYVKNGPHLIDIATRYCVSYDLTAGVNMIGSGCIPEGLTAFTLLQDIGTDMVVSSIQRFNTQTSKFETAAYRDGYPVGNDFPIVVGASYIVFMKQDVNDFKIHEIQ